MSSFKISDKIKIKSLNGEGIVKKVDKKFLIVDMNGITINIKFSDAELIVDNKKSKSQDKPKVNEKDKETTSMPTNYYIPLGKDINLNRGHIENFNLLLNKYIKLDYDKNKNEYKIDLKQIDDNLFKMINISYDDFFKNNMTIKGLFKEGYYKDFSMKNDYKMNIGLGSASVYKTSMTVHHIYGIPYIPGQSIKGITRSYIISSLFKLDESNIDKLRGTEKNEKDLKIKIGNQQEELAMSNDEFKSVFGSSTDKGHKGEVIFLDAYPKKKNKIELDIMNPHYGKYYKGEKAPSDDENPIPINFLVLKGAEFEFTLGSHKKKIDEYKIEDKTIDVWMKEALENHGIGSKTAVGYGYFE